MANYFRNENFFKIVFKNKNKKKNFLISLITSILKLYELKYIEILMVCFITTLLI